MASDLAPVYLDDTRVTLQGDPRPPVAKILQAGGQGTPDGVLVIRLREASGADGQPVSLTDVIDRQEATTPVYLRVVKGAESAGTPTDPSGDITRGTDAASPSESGEEAARAGRQGFAESQAFGDPVHRGGSPRVAQGARPSREVPPGHHADGGVRTQEPASEEGARPLRSPGRVPTPTTRRGSLEKASEEE